MPGFKRAVTRMKLTPRINRSFVRLGGSNGLFAKISESRPNHEIGRFGSTPMMVVGTPFSVMLRPRIVGSELNRLRQKLSVTITTSPLLSSSGKKLRPRIGWMPSNSK